jgi:hypothetical protein
MAGNVPLAAGFALLLGWSAFTHFQGATSKAASDWNVTPINIDAKPSPRVWDWSNTSFLAAFRSASPPR